MNEYTEQAKNFLSNANATMTIELVGCDIPTNWKDETRKHNHYKFTITSPHGSMSDDFWDSIHNTELRNETFESYCLNNYKKRPNNMYLPERNKIIKEWKLQILKATPTEYDVLSCLETYLPDTFDDFCMEYGYDNDSINALNTYMAVQKQVSKLCKIFTYDQLVELAEIR